jgi:hypothetical protein
MIMGISKVELNYWNFEDEKSTAIMYCIEDVDYDRDGFLRTFICFENEEYNINNILELIDKNIQEIHEAIGNMDKIGKLIEHDNIRYTSKTSKYWDDVRLFPHTSSFHYAEDIYNLAALEVEINKHIKNKFYNKDKIIDACEKGDVNKALELLHKGKFTEEEMKPALEVSSKVKEVFDKYNLHNVLAEVLPVNEDVKPKAPKI